MQSVWLVLAFSLYELSGQARHEVAPNAFWYCPCTHSRQSADPFAALKVPDLQAEHCSPSLPLCPAMQTQAIIDAEPTAESVLAGQDEHEDPAITSWYFPVSHPVQEPEPFHPLYEPTAQALQAAPSAPWYPMLQMQTELPMAESVWAGQVTHADPAVTFRYVPASHCAHDPDPAADLNPPAKHALHAAPSVPSYPTLQMQSDRASACAGESV
eukprot:3478938-Rhodomonas_salina.5